MSIKTIKIKVCDICDKEIKGRLITHTCPICHADICPSCQQKEDAKSRPPGEIPETNQTKTGSEDKEERHAYLVARGCAPRSPGSLSPEDAIRKGRGNSVSPPAETLAPLLSTFSVKVGQGKEANELKLGQFTVKHQELKEGAKELLILAKLTLEDVEKAPDSQGKEELLSILK